MEVLRLSNGQGVRSTLVIFFFNWRIIALQYCSSLCHTSPGISHNYIYIYIYMCVCVCVCIHISSILSLPPPPIQPLEVIIEGKAGFPVLYSSFPLLIYPTHGSVYMSVILSQFILPSPSPAVSTSLFSISLSPFLLCK